MPHYIAERMITTKYKKTKLVNYRQQRDNLNILETCTFIDCDQYRTNDNELHQVICNTFKIDYLQEMDIIIKIQNR